LGTKFWHLIGWMPPAGLGKGRSAPGRVRLGSVKY